MVFKMKNSALVDSVASSGVRNVTLLDAALVRNVEIIASNVHKNTKYELENVNGTLKIFIQELPHKTAAQLYNEYRSTPEYQKQALLYIIVVLLFYSITIVALMIKYVRQGKRRDQEEKTFQDFLSQTKRLSMQQEKRDFARRVSLQLLTMASMGSTFASMRYPDRTGRLTPLILHSDRLDHISPKSPDSVFETESGKLSKDLVVRGRGSLDTAFTYCRTGTATEV